MSISVEFDGIIQEVVEFGDLWCRTVKIGEAEGFVGAEIIVTLSKPFSHEEDALFKWVMEQDGCQVFGIYGCRDGRDLIVFERTYSKQTPEDAVAEHREHLRRYLSGAGIKPLLLAR